MYADSGDPAPARPAVLCPGCASQYTTDVQTPSQRNLLCLSCGACWHRTEGRWERVRMRDCEGCSYQAVCLAAQ